MAAVLPLWELPEWVFPATYAGMLIAPMACGLWRGKAYRHASQSHTQRQRLWRTIAFIYVGVALLGVSYFIIGITSNYSVAYIPVLLIVAQIQLIIAFCAYAAYRQQNMSNDSEPYQVHHY